MKNTTNLVKFGEKLSIRTAHRHGHSCIITIPMECIDRKYTRYIDKVTGVIILVPVTDNEGDAREEREETA